jgi:hypothetical protein
MDFMNTPCQNLRSLFGFPLLATLSLFYLSTKGFGQDFELFETKIRPSLHTHCLSCHHQGNKSGGLALDSREGWEIGGDSGPAVNLKKPQESLLIRVINHAEPGLEMPDKAPKLSDATIAEFVQWIESGALDPRDEPEPLSAVLSKSWEELYRERSNWWAFQPLHVIRENQQTTTQAIDHWIQQKLQQQQIQSSDKADPHTLLRRLSFQLRGLPPSIEEIEKYIPELSNPSESTKAWEQVVDKMLESTEFAEHWARHWMDIVRYAETHGSEDDAYLPFAYRYRDYLIRAFREDVSIQRLIQEHLAGDLIPPRWNDALRLNESLIGLCFYRLLEFNQTPIDVKREEIAVIDNQIDAIGKAFQGLTISCARCHDHKFDPISDEDYYSLYGILRSMRTAMRCIDTQDQFAKPIRELQALQTKINPSIFEGWLEQTMDWGNQISKANQWLQEKTQEGVIKPGQKWGDIKEVVGDEEPWRRALARWVCNPSDSAIDPWIGLLAAPRESAEQLRAKARLLVEENSKAWRSIKQSTKPLFDLRQGEFDGWRISGAGLPEVPLDHNGQTAGIFWSVLGNKKYPLTRLLEPGYHSNLWSDRSAGSLRSPDFLIDSDAISLLCRGTDNARARLVIENFQGDSLLFDTLNPNLRSNALQWVTMRIRPQWKGLRAYIELLTRDAKPYVGIHKDPSTLEKTDGRSSFGLAMAIAHDGGYRPPAVIATPTDTNGDLDIDWFITQTQSALKRLAQGVYKLDDVRWVNALIDEDILGWNRQMPQEIMEANSRYKEIESSIPIPRWVPGVIEDRMGINQAWLPRGDHKSPGSVMPRRYLQVLGSSVDHYQEVDSGRLSLAMEITNPSNPLTARVYVNRVWAWLTGEGIVSSVDNFGRMGQFPSHPELLDRLASDFIESGWSNKRLIRAIVLSESWQRSSLPTPSAIEKDPGNQWFSHANFRRAQAEAIRDSLLFVAGNLRRPDGGLGTRNHYKSILEPNKQSPPGPIDGDARRSIYLEVRRNFPDEFLTAFDFPKPIATVGKRYTTNGPMQSLMLLNDPFVVNQAKIWSDSMTAKEPDPIKRVGLMYLGLLSRPMTQVQQESAMTLLQELMATTSQQDAWAGLAHAMLNLKEVWYIK